MSHIKALIISDIHSNIGALNAVYEQEKDSDIICCAGDLADYGFYPNEVIDWFKAHNVLAVSGNHDRGLIALLQTGERPDKDNAGTFTRYNLACLSRESIAYLSSLPLETSFELDGITYYMKHAYNEELLHTVAESLTRYESVALFEKIWAEKMPACQNAEKRRIIYGHTHRCCIHLVKGNTFWLNPGSLSYRLGGDSQAKGADYMIIQDGEVLLRHIDYPMDHLVKLVEQSAFTDSEKAIGYSFYRLA